jgi:PAS domain S-box-containing protein
MPLWGSDKRQGPETHDLLSLALEASGAGVWSWELATQEVVWSERTAELFGTPLEEFDGSYEGFLARVHPEDRDAVARTIAEALENRDQCRQEFRIVLKDGGIRWIFCMGRCFYDAGGQPVRLTGTVTDATSRRASEEALRDAKESAERRALRLKLLSETAAELLTHERPQDLTESIFRRFSSHLGLEIYFHFRLAESGDHLALVSSRGIPEESLPGLREIKVGQPVCGLAVLRKMPITVEDMQTSRDKRLSHLRALGITAYACHPLIADNRVLGTLSFGTRGRSSFDPGELDLMRTLCDQVASAVERSRLIEELRQRSREAQEAREAAEEANRIKDQFLATLSHELRTPLTPVLLIAQALETDPRVPAELHRDIERMRRNVELEARLIDDLLDLTRIARGKIQLHSEVVDLHALLTEAVETTAGPGRPRFDLDFAAPVARVWGDVARLRQVFGNLLGNAVKFTPPEGTITVRTRATEDGQVRVEVRDSGEGIGAEVLPRIFDAFEQGGSQITRRFGGLGLGLAISRNLVELHGGSIAAASEGPGRGAVFTVTLPVVEAPAAGAEPPVEERREVDRSLHVLLVEDHADTAEAMADLLRTRGYRVTVALSRAAGLAAAAAADGLPSIDVVVSDLGLPDGSGLDLMREISRRHGLSGIAVSGFGTEEDIRQSREAGFAEHLTKPIDLRDLERALQRVVGGGR